MLDKRIIVTGSTYGIGAAVTQALVEAGATVAAMARSVGPGEQQAKDLGSKGPGSIAFYRCDISQRADVKEAFANAVKTMGGLDVLMHVAGVEGGGAPEDETDDDWDHTFAINAKGTFIVNQEAFPYLKANGGAIINFGASVASTGLATNSVYAASKGAVAAWSRSIAAAWGQYGITVNQIYPAVWSPMYDEHRARLTPEQLAEHDARMRQMIHMGGKLGDAYRDLTPMVVFMCGDGARYITGQSLCIDGGAQKMR